MPNSTGGTSNGTSIGTRCEPQTVHNKKELKEEIYRKNYKSARARDISEKKRSRTEKENKETKKLINKLNAKADEFEKQQKFNIA